MTIDRVAVFLGIFLVVVTAGCGRRDVEIRTDASKEVVWKVDPSSKEANGPEVIKEVGPNTTVVTGEPATTSENETEDAATTAEDKPGAVAVKTSY